MGLSVLGVPTAAGAYGPGQDRTPRRLRDAGLLEALGGVHGGVTDLGDVAGAGFADDPDRPDAQNVDEVLRVVSEVADAVASVPTEEDLLVVGGDCTVEIGVVAGAVRRVERVGLVYVDLDADLNVPASGDGRLDWMGVGHLLDLPGAVPSLAGAGPRRPLLAPADVRLLGATNLTAFERDAIARLDLDVEPVGALGADPGAAVERTARWAAGFDAVPVHVDVDVLDFDDFPVAQNTRRGVGGLALDRLQELLVGLWAIPSRRVLTVSEIHLDHHPAPDVAARRVIDLLAAPLCGPRPERGPRG